MHRHRYGRRLRPLLFPVLLVAACGKSSTSVDPAVENRIATIDGCFQPAFARVREVVQLVASWRRTGTTPIDPPGLVWSQRPDGTIDAAVDLGGDHLRVDVRFCDPAGTPQNFNLGSSPSLAAAIDEAATRLRALHGDNGNFVVANWELSGDAMGSGSLTALVGVASTGNTLMSVATTQTLRAGFGMPPTAPGVLQLDSPPCVLTFRTEGLVVDASPTQSYPIGVIDLALTGTRTTVAATVMLHGESTARVEVAGVPGFFTYDLDGGGLVRG